MIWPMACVPKNVGVCVLYTCMYVHEGPGGDWWLGGGGRGEGGGWIYMYTLYSMPWLSRYHGIAYYHTQTYPHKRVISSCPAPGLDMEQQSSNKHALSESIAVSLPSSSWTQCHFVMNHHFPVWPEGRAWTPKYAFIGIDLRMYGFFLMYMDQKLWGFFDGWGNHNIIWALRPVYDSELEWSPRLWGHPYAMANWSHNRDGLCWGMVNFVEVTM